MTLILTDPPKADRFSLILKLINYFLVTLKSFLLIESPVLRPRQDGAGKTQFWGGIPLIAFRHTTKSGFTALHPDKNVVGGDIA